MYDVNTSIQTAKLYRAEQIRTAEEYRRAKLASEPSSPHLHIHWDRVASFLRAPRVAHR